MVQELLGFTSKTKLKSDGVKEAWSSYCMLIQLTEQLPESNDQVLKHGERLVNEKPIDPDLINAMIM